MNRLRDLKHRLRELEAEIADTESRLPAHSIKPPIMQALLALEDERDEVIKQIEALTQKKPS